MREKLNEEEVDFLDVVQVLTARKFVLLGGALICALLAAVVTIFLPKQYEMTALLDVARVADQPLENSYFVEQVINSEPFLGMISQRANANKSAREMKDLITAESDQQKSQFLVSVTVRGATPSQVVGFAKAVGGAIEERE